ncbi:MAG: SAM-dependent DNA methyltransferase, partial [Desulfobacterales bacterium]|nr:SAM-dependent DNA methyltransferase [Desulfobacterales bacterium]
PDGLLVVENLHDVGKKKMKPTKALIEPDLVYPLLRGRDIQRWQAKHSAYIIMVQDPQKRTGYDEAWLKVQYPLTYAYLKEFETVLRERSGYKKYFDPQKDPFYSMYDVAEYTFAPYKVVWPWIATGLTACVVADWESKLIIPEHNTSFASFDDVVEARYLCALLNSTPCDFTIRAYAAGGGGGLASPKSLQIVHIPRFQNTDTQSRLASLSQRAHELAAQGKAGEEELHRVEEEIDLKAAELWGLSKEELEEIKRSLVEIS